MLGRVTPLHPRVLAHLPRLWDGCVCSDRCSESLLCFVCPRQLCWIQLGAVLHLACLGKQPGLGPLGVCLFASPLPCQGVCTRAWARWLQPPSKPWRTRARALPGEAHSAGAGVFCAMGHLRWWQGHIPAPAAPASPTTASALLLGQRPTPCTAVGLSRCPRRRRGAQWVRERHQCPVLISVHAGGPPARSFVHATPCRGCPLGQGSSCPRTPHGWAWVSQGAAPEPAGAWAVPATPLRSGKSSGCAMPTPLCYVLRCKIF